MALKPVKRGSVRVARWDGAAWSLVPCAYGSDGVLRSHDGRLQFGAELCTFLADDLAVIATSELRLLEETDFHTARARIVFRSLFENNSDVMELVRNGVTFACLVVAILLFFKMGSIDHVSAGVDDLLKHVGRG